MALQLQYLLMFLACLTATMALCLTYVYLSLSEKDAKLKAKKKRKAARQKAEEESAAGAEDDEEDEVPRQAFEPAASVDRLAASAADGVKRRVATPAGLVGNPPALPYRQDTETKARESELERRATHVFRRLQHFDGPIPEKVQLVEEGLALFTEVEKPGMPCHAAQKPWPLGPSF